ncbi:unnamed protein product [Rotaria sp. Silwood2]|nr:unnamed protein product [Rotaria sp. Silwood2]
MCQGCFNDIKSSIRPECSVCRDGLLPMPIVNRDVLNLIEAVYETMAAIPLIKAEELIIESKPFGYGGSADVCRAQWNRHTVVVKRLRTNTNDPKQLSQLKGEISIHVGLRHPYLKPENVLIAQDNRAKLSDFGMARVLAIIQHNTSGSGTPKYTAPELLDANTKYGEAVDIYSVSLILYEMFSGKIAFENLSPHQLLAAVYLHKKRPDFDSTFPKNLREKIEL